MAPTGQTIADLHRQSMSCGRSSRIIASIRICRKSRSPEFFRASLCHIMRQTDQKVLGFAAGAAFREWQPPYPARWQLVCPHRPGEVFPGRLQRREFRRRRTPLHLDLLQDAPITIALSPDTMP